MSKKITVFCAVFSATVWLLAYATAGAQWRGARGTDDPSESASSGPGAVRVSRYATAPLAPEAWQADILLTPVKHTFSRKVRTVGAALELLLERSGYRLAREESTDPAFLRRLKLPLPEAHRSIGPLPLIDAFRILAGAGVFIPVVDPVNRLLSAELMPQWRQRAKRDLLPGRYGPCFHPVPGDKEK